MIEIRYTRTFSNTLDALIDHLSCHSSELQALHKVENFIENFENRVFVAPLSCQISPQLIEVGVNSFREYNFDGLRIIYRATNSLIIGDLILSQKQNIQRSLIEYCLIYKQ